MAAPCGTTRYAARYRDCVRPLRLPPVCAFPACCAAYPLRAGFPVTCTVRSLHQFFTFNTCVLLRRTAPAHNHDGMAAANVCAMVWTCNNVAVGMSALYVGGVTIAVTTATCSERSVIVSYSPYLKKKLLPRVMITTHIDMCNDPDISSIPKTKTVMTYY